MTDPTAINEVSMLGAVTLHRCDPARNLHRCYRLHVQMDLFGNWCLIRQWGRIGQFGHIRSDPFPTLVAAYTAFERQRAAKERRGYAQPA
jgi:predicted DNA-binding WGR domain protein